MIFSDTTHVVLMCSPPDPPPCSGPEPPVSWSLSFGGQLFSANVFRRSVLCVDWLVPGARPGEIASLSTISTNPVPLPPPHSSATHSLPTHPTHLWPAGGRLNTRLRPPPWDDACVWRLIGGRAFALYPSPPAAIFFLPARDETSCVRRGLTVELVTVYEYELWICCVNLWLRCTRKKNRKKNLNTKTQPSIYLHYRKKGGTEGSARLAAEILDTQFCLFVCFYWHSKGLAARKWRSR